MKTTIKTSLAIASVIIVMFQGCAIIQPPSGGPKDTTPPKIKKSEPISGSTNFTGNAIKLDFDEFIVLNNLAQELIVSPPLKHKPEFKIKGKSLFIGFKDTLENNTTYTFNLGQGVKDYHEGNILDSNIIVFSTGGFIDSGSVTGGIRDAFTLKPIEKTLVMLYPDWNDSVPAKKKPFYYSKSKKSGDFSINYLKNGKYYLFVLEDKNNNFIYDLSNERIGFSDKIVSIGDIEDSSGQLKIHLFKEFIPNQFFIGSKVEQYGKVLLGFNQPLKDFSLKVLNGEVKPNWYLPEYDLEKDTVWLWTNLEVEKDQVLELEISDNNEVLDTIELKLTPRPEKEEELIKLQNVISLKEKGGVVKYFETLEFSSTNPIDNIDLTGVIIRKKDTSKIKIDNSNLLQFKRSFAIPFKLKQESHYTLLIYKNSITDLFGFKNDTLTFSFKTLSDIEYASLEVNIENEGSSKKILQLMTNSKEEILKEIVIDKNQKIDFPNLSPGKYKLKMIFDTNGNGKWDPGSFIPRRQPERVIYFSKELEMKEGWDKKITWAIPTIPE